MNPIDFDESNTTLARPADMTGEECKPLPVCSHPEGVISCWKPSPRERLSLLFFGRLWFHVRTTSGTHPPIGLLATRQYFLPTPREGSDE